ncbi:hypothetical protein FHX81_2993 [Saccharothrix saharensis]|uniref:Uncharacterized protein n=1 Tax=Saccharothrix saharensis TaxID=571190 RepID=A0A543JCW0_9PSEU|nr:hypothetical protein FHX81_2993 [Saccharothrix saharensis]
MPGGRAAGSRHRWFHGGEEPKGRPGSRDRRPGHLPQAIRPTSGATPPRRTAEHPPARNFRRPTNSTPHLDRHLRPFRPSRDRRPHFRAAGHRGLVGTPTTASVRRPPTAVPRDGAPSGLSRLRPGPPDRLEARLDRHRGSRPPLRDHQRQGRGASGRPVDVPVGGRRGRLTRALGGRSDGRRTGAGAAGPPGPGGAPEGGGRSAVLSRSSDKGSRRPDRGGECAGSRRRCERGGGRSSGRRQGRIRTRAPGVDSAPSSRIRSEPLVAGSRQAGPVVV